MHVVDIACWGNALQPWRWLTPQHCFCAVSEFCERLAYYSVSTNLVQYLLDILGFDLVTANNTVRASPGAPSVPLLLLCGIWHLGAQSSLRRMHADPRGGSAAQTNNWSGACYLFPVLGAYIADSHWGRYNTIIVFSIIYILVH